MGDPYTPNESDRTEILGIANAVIQAVSDDEEGPFALPDFQSARSWGGKVDLLKNWWSDVDFKILRLSQDLVDTRAALEVACALLAKSGTCPAGDAAPAMAARLRALDMPSQEELDTFAGSTTPCGVGAEPVNDLAAVEAHLAQKPK